MEEIILRHVRIKNKWPVRVYIIYRIIPFMEKITKQNFAYPIGEVTNNGKN
jgi:hypothetical protein